MKTVQFKYGPETLLRVSPTVTLTIPGGMIVPSNYSYVDLGDHLIDQCMAAWTPSDGQLPMAFRLVGPPGVGKNRAVYKLASLLGQPLYYIAGHEDLTAEDLVVSASLGSGGKIRYIASPLLAAMHTGGICFIDEIAKMRPRALAPLAPVLDEQRSIYSALLGMPFTAKPEFRFCAAYNPTDADTFDLPPWLRRRTLPELEVTRPSMNALEKILRDHDTKGSSLSADLMIHFRAMKAAGQHVDAGTAVRIQEYVRRLSSYQAKLKKKFANEIELAIKQIGGTGLGSQRKKREHS